MTRLVFNSRLVRMFPAGVKAIAFDDTVYIRDDSISPLELAHELAHLTEQKKVGKWRWLARYLVDSVRFRQNPAEERADAQVLARAGVRDSGTERGTIGGSL